ncbi:hypothetical protein [Sedimentibacter sp. LTW-03]|uniref:hypothetical protein n=1 Tax=Sedimentibacter sp. LTW-03 TaxID=3453406 RepID=UPI003F837477
MILLFIALSLVAVDIIQNIDKNRGYRFRPVSKKFNGNYFSVKIGVFINKNNFLRLVKTKYANKMTLINHFEKEQNENNIDKFILNSVLISFFFSMVFLYFFTIWYVGLAVFLVSIFLMIYCANIYIGNKLNKIYAHFPIAIQLFTDEYVSCRNIKNALNNCYGKMPHEISRVFETLARRYASESNYITIINDFAEGLDFVWGYAFAELLLLSYEGAGDISEDLIYLNELANEEIKAEMETETAIVGTKLIFVILNVATVVGLIFSLKVVPISKYIYLYTPVGNFGLIFWICSFILGLAVLKILKYI